MPVLFRNATIFDGDSSELKKGFELLVQGDTIAKIAPATIEANPDVPSIDCTGRVLMPGLIDAHVHVYIAGLDLTRIARAPLSYLAHYAARFLRASLDRGFTTVRDVGGGDVGLASALKEGLIEGAPRLFYGGRAISQTGGHADFRPGDQALSHACHYGCACEVGMLNAIADGVDEVRKTVREELRRGASHIKLMASGGVASPTDPLERCQYSEEEIRAAVEEADRAGSYVAAHCHPAEAIRRSAALGVRSIEHATLIDQPTAEFVAQRGAYTVPTLVTIATLLQEGERLGFPRASMDKLRRIGDRAFDGLEIMRRAGVRMGLGTDLLGALHVHQSQEFILRSRVLPAIDILRSACAINAELLGQSGWLGCVREGAAADLLLVDGNPLEDIAVLADRDRLSLIMKGGQIHKWPRN